MNSPDFMTLLPTAKFKIETFKHNDVFDGTKSSCDPVCLLR